MILINARNNHKIATDAKHAESFSDRLLGLIDPRNPRSLVFSTRFGIHTFFLRSAIDVLLLDDSNNVVAFKKHLVPFRFFFYNPVFSRLIELPAGAINRADIRMNDKILIA